MADISKITLPDNLTYILRDSRLDNYAICISPSGVARKEITIKDTFFTLETGVVVIIKFSVVNTADNAILSVNGSEAKPIYYKGYPIKPYYLKGNGTYKFIYTGSQWDLIGDIDGTEENIKEYSKKNFFPLIGEPLTIYIDKDAHLIYYWSSDKYIKVKGSFDGLQITDEQIINVSANKITGLLKGTQIQKGSISLDKLSQNVYTQNDVNNLIDGVYLSVYTNANKIEEIQNKIESGDFDGLDAINIIIDSSGGNIFVNNVISTVLRCYVYKGSTDITKNNNYIITYTWKKLDGTNGNEVLDWTPTPVAFEPNAIRITTNDVNIKAIFKCIVQIKEA